MNALRLDQIKGLIPSIVIAPADYTTTDGWVNPSFTCTSNETTNTDKINALVDKLHTSGGGIVHLLAGTIKITNTSGVSGQGCLKIYDNIHYEGNGQGLTTLKIVNNTGFNTAAFRVGDPTTHFTARNWSISNLKIDGDQASNAADTTTTIKGIIYGADHSVTDYQAGLIEDVTITGCKSGAFCGEGRTDNVIIKDCEAVDCGVQSSAQSADFAYAFSNKHGSGITYQNCWAVRCSGAFYEEGYTFGSRFDDIKAVSCGNGLTGSGKGLYQIRGATVKNTTLGAAMSDTTSPSVTLTSSTGFLGTSKIPLPALIGSEIVLITSSTTGSNNITVLRGQWGTTAATHSNGTAVYLVQVSENIMITNLMSRFCYEQSILMDAVRGISVNGITSISDNQRKSSSIIPVTFATNAVGGYPNSLGVTFGTLDSILVEPIINPATGKGYGNYNVFADTATSNLLLYGRSTASGATDYLLNSSSTPDTVKLQIEESGITSPVSAGDNNIFTGTQTFTGPIILNANATFVSASAGQASPEIIMQETSGNTTYKIYTDTSSNAIHEFGNDIRFASNNFDGVSSRNMQLYAGISTANRTANMNLKLYGSGTNANASLNLSHNGTDAIINSGKGKLTVNTTDNASVYMRLSSVLEIAGLPAANPSGTSNKIYANNTGSDGTPLKIDSN